MSDWREDLALAPGDAQAAYEWFRAQTVTKREPVDLWRVQRALIETGEWPGIVLAQQSTSPPVAGLAISAVSYIGSPRFEHIDMDLESAQAMVAGLVSAGLISQSSADALDAMATVTVPKYDQQPHAGDIKAARGEV